MPARKGRQHNLDRRAFAPIVARHALNRAPLGLFEPRYCAGIVEGERLAVFDDLPAIDKDVAYRPLGRRIDKAADRVVERPHRRVLGVNDHEIGLRARRQPAEIVATECGSAPDGRSSEDVGRGSRHGYSRRRYG